jgi:hypothetical protein
MSSTNAPIERITWREHLIATIIRANHAPSSTTFVTTDAAYQQAGFIVYPKDGVAKRHSHLPLERHLVGTPETLMVRKGKVACDLYGLDKSPLGTWTLGVGDLILLTAGGHGFRFLEDTILLEIKQGPYTGLVEKEYF